MGARSSPGSRGLPRRALPLAGGSAPRPPSCASALRTPDGAIHGAGAPHAPPLRRAVPPRVGEHLRRPPHPGELPRPHPRPPRAGCAPPGTRRGSATGPRPCARASTTAGSKAWCRARGGVRRAVRRPRPCDLEVRRARPPPPASAASRSSGRPDQPARGGRALRRRNPVDHRRSTPPAASCGPRARLVTTAGTGSRACGSTPRARPSTSPAASPDTWVTSSGPQCGARAGARPPPLPDAALVLLRPADRLRPRRAPRLPGRARRRLGRGRGRHLARRTTR